MERETREFTTPGGHKISLRTYLTGREANELKGIMYAALKMNMDDIQSGRVNLNDIPGSFLVEQEQKALGMLLVSLDGDSSNALERLLDLPQADYESVIAEVNKIQIPTTPEKSGQPGAGTSQAA